MNETLQTIKARRSVRAYMEQQVSAEDLNLLSLIHIWNKLFSYEEQTVFFAETVPLLMKG